jgi:hypothetical protein
MVATPSRRSISSYVGSLRPPSRRLAIYRFSAMRPKPGCEQHSDFRSMLASLSMLLACTLKSLYIHTHIYKKGLHHSVLPPSYGQKQMLLHSAFAGELKRECRLIQKRERKKPNTLSQSFIKYLNIIYIKYTNG